MDGGGRLLVVIADVNVEWWANQNATHNATDSFQHCMDSIMVFCNSYLMLSHSNKLGFIACHADECRFIYPSAVSTAASNLAETVNDGKFDLFSEVNDSILEQLKQMVDPMNHSESLQQGLPSLLAGALTKALCYIHNFDKNTVGLKTQSRILVLKSSEDTSNQYMSVMNCIFGAQKKDIVIDCCALKTHSGFLQQACDITEGTYFTVENLSGLLEYLLWMFLPEPHLRKKLNLPQSVQIDYRAACFCHKKLVDVGFVCSVCLSIYCQFMPKCATCQTRFKLPILPGGVKGKKKKKDAKKIVL